MRHPIDTAPRDGKFVILEDDVSGSFELAQWSAEAPGWVTENGELSKITPTHWQTRHLPQEGEEFILQDELFVFPPKEIRLSELPPSPDPRFLLFPSRQAAPQRPRATELPRQVANADHVTVARLRAPPAQSEHRPRARRWFAVSSIAAGMVGASLIALYFHAGLVAFVTRYSGELNNVRIGTAEVVEQRTPVPIRDSQQADSLDPALYQQADRASSQAPQDTALAKQDAAAIRAEAQRPLEKEQRGADAPADEQAAQPSQAAEGTTGELRRSLQKEHDRAEALTGELGKARRDLETQLVLSSRAADEAAKVKQTAERATAELRQSLQQEHDRAQILTAELANAQRNTETQLALSSKEGDEAAKVKQSAESATAELRQSLQQEHDRAEALRVAHGEA